VKQYFVKAKLTGGVTRGGTEEAVEFISTLRYPREHVSIETPPQLVIDAVNSRRARAKFLRRLPALR